MKYDKFIKHINGRKKGDVFLFALSTCGWCGLTKKLLTELGVEYGYVDVDLLEGDARDDAVQEMGKHAKSTSFPTILINGKCILGYQEDELRRLLQ